MEMISAEEARRTIRNPPPRNVAAYFATPWVAGTFEATGEAQVLPRVAGYMRIVEFAAMEDFEGSFASFMQTTILDAAHAAVNAATNPTAPVATFEWVPLEPIVETGRRSLPCVVVNGADLIMVAHPSGNCVFVVDVTDLPSNIPATLTGAERCVFAFYCYKMDEAARMGVDAAVAFFRGRSPSTFHALGAE